MATAPLGSFEISAGWDFPAGPGPAWGLRPPPGPAAPGRPVRLALHRDGRPVASVSGIVLTVPYGLLRAGDPLPGLLLTPPYGTGDPVTAAELAGGVLRWAAGQGIRSVAATYLDPAAGALAAALVAAGGTEVPVAERSELAVTWRDLDGYLASLPRTYRAAVRRDLRALAEADVRVTWETLPADPAELVGLRCARRGADPGAEAERLARIRAGYGDAVTLFAARAGGALVSFGLFAHQGSTWTPLLTGAGRPSPGHYATLFYEPAAMAPRLGVGTIPYGLGPGEGERRRGCRLVPLTGVRLRLP